ncbi:MAG: polysaccharide biosynthesis tyrosine autokinase, partial [Planctomycetota bacterium]
TTATTVIAAVNSQGTFTAALDKTPDPTNDGSGLVGQSLFGLGTKGTTQLTAGRVAAVVCLPNQNNDFVITAPKPEPVLTNVDIVFVHKDADGDRAIVSFDDANRTLSIDVDPAATTAKTVIAAVNSQGAFTAALDFAADSTNKGTELVGALDPELAIASCGTATVRLDGDNDDFILTASTPGPEFENVDLVLKHQAASGNEALVTFDAESRTLTVDIDPTATTAKTVVDAINAEKTFIAELDRAADRDNDGSGLVSKSGVTVPHAQLEKELMAHPEVQAMQASLMAKEAKRREYEMKLEDYEKESRYQALLKQISEEKAALAERRNELRSELETWVRPAVINQRKDELAGMYSQLRRCESTAQRLQERQNQAKELEQDKRKEAGVRTVELEFAQSELARAQEVLNKIADRILALETEHGAPPRVTKQFKASAPTAPTNSWYTRALLAVLTSFCLPFGLALLWERLVRRVTDAQQLEEHSNVAVVGEVARLPVRTVVPRGASSKRVGRALGIFEESIDSLRTCLILSEPLSDMKVLAVTSGTKREGKTSVAVQLAMSIARASGEPTLLVDGDMRSPDIHNLLDVPLEPGLGDVLAKQCPLKDAIVSDWSQPVHLLPAGKLHASPHKLLGNGVVESLFEEIRGAYRYVVVDTPPILAAGEALVLARAADASLICAMRDVSRIDQIKKTHERLLAANARPVGIVLNGIPAKRYTYRYGNYAYSQE